MKRSSMKWMVCMVLALSFASSGCDEGNGEEDALDGEEDALEGDARDEVGDETAEPDGVEGEIEGDQPDAQEEEVELPPQPARLIIFHTNDEHSHLLATGPNADDWPLAEIAGDGSLKGNIYRRAVLLNQERGDAAAADIPTITVSAADYTMGTLFHLGSVLQGIDYKLMTILGYDAATIGNHEFDFGASTLATMLENGGLLEGIPLSIPIVSSNIHFSAGTGDDALEALYSPDGSGGALLRGYTIKTLPDGLRIGFIGIMGLDAALVAPFKSPVTFSLALSDQACTESWECTAGASCVRGFCTTAAIQDSEAHMPALIADVAEAARIVRDEGVDLLIALSHAGVNDLEAEAIMGGGLDPLDAAYSEDLILAREVTRLLAAEGIPGIDVIVGGHSHTKIDYPIIVQEPAVGDHQTTVVQAGGYGKFLGRLEIYRDDVGLPWQVEGSGSRLMEIDDRLDVTELPGAARGLIDQVVEGTMGALEDALLGGVLSAFNPAGPVTDDPAVVGDLFFHTVAESDFDVRGEAAFRETSLMHLVTDGSRTILNRAIYPMNPVKVYVQANGVIRDSLLMSRADEALSMADTFNVLPLGVSPIEATPGYPVIDFYMSAAELKAGLEVGLSMGFQSDSFFLGYSGAKVEYDPNLPAFDPASPTTTGRITKMTLWDPATDADLMPWEDDYGDVIFDITVTPDPFTGRRDELIHVATNLYLGLFIEGFGLCPRNASGQWDPLCGICANTDADCDDGLGNTAHCLDDDVAPDIGRCIASSIPSVVKYIVHTPGPGPELKEFVTLVGYLQNMPDMDGNSVANLPAAYDVDDPASSYPSRICCVQSPFSPADPCCHGEPCATNYLACP